MKITTQAIALSMMTLSLVCATDAQAAPSYQVLYGFTGSPGAYLPAGLLVQGSDGNLYGTSNKGGPADSSLGTIFEYNMTSMQVTTVHQFDGGSVANDGYFPVAGMVRSGDGTLYGTTPDGGTGHNVHLNIDRGLGTIFSYNSTSQIETVVHSFGDGSVLNDGNNPEAPLCQDSNGNIYGTTEAGGSTALTSPFIGFGTIFEFSPKSGQVTILHSFGDGSVSHEGRHPTFGLVQAVDGNLYGVNGGGTAGEGSIFEYNLTTKQVTIVHSFGDGSVANDGSGPVFGLTAATDGNLYGTTYGGGTDNPGKIFKFNVFTKQETILHSFADGSVVNDGQYPSSGLLLASDGNLYGTTMFGGSDGRGTVYEYDRKSGKVSILHSFQDGTVANDGYSPQGVIQASDGNLYGTTTAGGSGTVDGTITGGGALFELSLPGALPPPGNLTAIAGTGRVSLSWQASESATSYNVYSGTESGHEHSTPIATGITLTNHIVLGLANGTTYYFTVAAVSAVGTSGMSNEATATTLSPPPAPSHLTATPGDSHVTLTWSASPGATSYHVYRGTTPGGESSTALVVGITGTTFTDSGLTNGKTYYYRVAAVGNGLRSRLSNEAHATPAAPATVASLPE